MSHTHVEANAKDEQLSKSPILGVGSIGRKQLG